MRGISGSLVLVLLAGCDAPAPEREPKVEAEPARPEPVKPEPAVHVEREPVPPEPPPKPAFDPAGVTQIRAKIIAIPNRKSWVPCGRAHSVGVLEVEVLDLFVMGEPPPRMLLFVSCPVDLGAREHGLVVGNTITVTLHARDQTWPKVTPLPEDLPRRYVESFVGSDQPGDSE